MLAEDNLEMGTMKARKGAVQRFKASKVARKRASRHQS